MLHLIPYPARVVMGEGVCPGGAVTERLCELSQAEAYRLTITPEGVVLEGSPAGLRLARVTLRQLTAQFGDSLPCLTIEDAPRYPWRGFMLDVSRHFLPVADVVRLMEAAAYFKINKLHWHLTDDQAWRLEIPFLPRLTEVGARRGRMHFAAIDEPEASHDFYTAEDVRTVLAAAERLGIEVVPEIEVPGHASALLTAYPEAGCGGAPSHIKDRGGIFDDLICAGKPESRALLADILRYVAALFPSPYLHLGGDEAAKRRWRACPACQRRICELGLTDENALQQHLLGEMKALLISLGKQPIVWNDALRGEALSTDFTVQAWWGDKALVDDFARRGGRIIQSTNAAYYFDYLYAQIDVGTVLAQEPCPADWSDRAKAAVMGLECTLWSERIPEVQTASRMLFPRLSAMAECAWTPADARDNASFDHRFRFTAAFLRTLGLSAAPEDWWRMDAAAAAEDEARLAKLLDIPEYRAACAADAALMAEERACYGQA